MTPLYRLNSPRGRILFWVWRLKRIFSQGTNSSHSLNKYLLITCYMVYVAEVLMVKANSFLPCHHPRDYSLSAFLIMCHFTIKKKQFSFAKRKYFVSKNEPSKKRITLGFYFKINVRKRNKSPVKEIMQSKRINSLEALSKTLTWVDSFYWSENGSSRSKELSQGHTCDLVGAEHTGPNFCLPAL